MLGLGTVRRVAGEVRRDLAAARARDPAARGVSGAEVLLLWPGLHALLAHRVAHALHELGLPLAPRTISATTRAITGIEIHPAARVGAALFIDHGVGAVIGETAEIGDDVTLYQGVTLGGTGFATGKRHPTVQDNVTIGSGAKLLGPITIGHGSKIGANSVVIHDVPPNSTVVGNPGHPVRVEGRRPEGPDADWVHLPDPVAAAVAGPAAELRNVELKARDPDPAVTLAAARAVGAEDRGVLEQRDTFFAVVRGRLKLREQVPGGAELIQYERADAAEARLSSYRVVAVPDPAGLRAALAAALGVEVEVRKRRRLLLWESVRIHLDAVEGLGSFVELEAVVGADAGLAGEHARVARLRDALGITDARLVAVAYADLVRGRAPARSPAGPGGA